MSIVCPNIEVLASDGSKLLRLTQWDTNRVIKIKGLPSLHSPAFHFYNINSKSAMVVIPTSDSSGSYTANIPNLILTEKECVLVSVYEQLSTGEGKTICTVKIPVEPRKRPQDYEFEEDIMYTTWVELTNEARKLLDELNAASGGIADAVAETKASAAAAKQSELNAKKNVDEAAAEVKRRADSGEFDGKPGVYVGADPAPDWTVVQVDPTVDEPFSIPDVFQERGKSEVDVMSQKSVSDELRKVEDTSINQLYKKFEKTGSIVTFDNGAEGTALDVVTQIVPRQTGTGVPSPTNVRPIVPTEKVELVRCGATLESVASVDLSTAKDRTHNTNLNLPNVKGNFWFNATVSLGKASFISVVISTADGSQCLNSNIKENGRISLSFTSENGITRLYNAIAAQTPADSVSTLTEITVSSIPEVGNEPYTGETYTATLPPDTYGGVVDWNTKTVNLDVYEQITEFYKVVPVGDFLKCYFKVRTKSNDSDNQYCSHALYDRDSNAKKTRFSIGISAGTITLPSSLFNTQDLAGANTWLAKQTLTFVFEPATVNPTDVTTSGTPTAIPGVNTLYSDTGDVTVSGFEGVNKPIVPYMNDTFADTVKETKTGSVIATDMVSPLEHEVGCRIDRINILPLLETSAETEQGVTYNIDTDSRFRFNGTATGGFYPIRMENLNLPRGTYVLSVKTTGFTASEFGGALAVYAYGGDESHEISALYTQDGKEQKITFTDTVPKFGITVNQGLKFENAVVEVQLSKTGEGFAPYVPNLADVTVSRIGGSLLRFNKDDRLMVGVDGMVKYQGDVRSIIIDCRGVKSVSITGDYTIINSGIVRAGKFSDAPDIGSKGTRINITENQTIDVSTTNYLLISFLPLPGKTFDDILASFMVNYGGQRSYVPYEPPKTYKAGESGNVDGVTSVQGKYDLALVTDNPGVTIEATYNLDTKKFVNSKIDEAVFHGYGKWEHIESFTLSESGHFSRSQELDGTPYSFRAAMLFLELPTGTSSTFTDHTFIGFQGYGSVTGRYGTVFQASFFPKGENNIYRFKAEVQHGFWTGCYIPGLAALVNTLPWYAGMPKHWLKHPVDEFPRIEKILTIGNPLPAGTELEIWGVK